MKNDRPINVFVDAHVFDGEYQGSRTFIKEIYNLLALKQDLQLHLGAYDIENLKKHFPGRSNVTFIKYESKSRYLRLLRDIPAIIKNNNIEYAHFQYIIPLLKKCRYIVTLHDVIFCDYPEEFSLSYRLVKKYLYRRSAAIADIVTTVSEHSKASIRKHLIPGRNNTIHIIPNGVHDRFFQPYNKEAAQTYIAQRYGFDKYILYVSRIEKRKNHVAALKAFLDLQLHSAGYHLVFLGHETKKVTELDELLSSLPETTRQSIYIDATVSDEDLLNFYKASATFVYPSRAEGFGIPPLEAGALRIPVICSNTSAMEAFTFFGKNHIDPQDYELFKKRLHEIITNSPGENDLAQLSETIRQQYSWTSAAEQLYSAIMKDRSLTTHSAQLN